MRKGCQVQRFLAIALVAMAMCLPAGAHAGDAPGCEGLEQFRAEIMPIGEQWADDLAALGITDPDWSPITMSSDDWLAYADIALAAHRALKTVDAPEWLAEWVAVQIDTTALQEQIGKAAASGGFLVVAAFDQEFEAIDKRDNEARTNAGSRCSDFAEFVGAWDALDGLIDGTPVPTPTR